jgi:hypothetical protein
VRRLAKTVGIAFVLPYANSPGDECLYFIIDSAADLILYVGETCRSNKRWKGIHACKDYIASYQDLHYRYGLQTAVNTAFWWDAPVERRARQELELNLILKWRSPFNADLSNCPYTLKVDDIFFFFQSTILPPRQ